MSEKTTTQSLVIINKEITEELKNPAIGRALLATTFKGLSEDSMKQAIFAGLVRGFKFKDFLEKNIYAIPFKDSYSLVTSIDYSRKVAMRSGVMGKSAPEFTYNADGNVESCTITIKRRVGQDIGEYTATVFFDEYYKEGRNGYPSLWDSKPRTMIAKVAEMHAYRMACPEEMSQLYMEEELQKEDDDLDHSEIDDDAIPVVHIGEETREDAPNMTIDKKHRADDFEMPESEEEQKNLIKGLLMKKFPDLDMKNAKAVKTQIGDYTELDYTVANYSAIIKALR